MKTKVISTIENVSLNCARAEKLVKKLLCSDSLLCQDAAVLADAVQGILQLTYSNYGVMLLTSGVSVLVSGSEHLEGKIDKQSLAIVKAAQVALEELVQATDMIDSLNEKYFDYYLDANDLKCPNITETSKQDIVSALSELDKLLSVLSAMGDVTLEVVNSNP